MVLWLSKPILRREVDLNTFFKGFTETCSKPEARYTCCETQRSPLHTKAQGRAAPRAPRTTKSAQPWLAAVQIATAANRAKAKSRNASKCGLGKRQSPSSSS